MVGKKMAEKFTHLHVHTEYSVLDGINKTEALAKHVKASGMDSCAITDHGVLHGVIDFYKQCNKHGVKPIMGIEAYVTDDEDGIENNRDKTRDNYHCIILAKNETGLHNLYWLTNQANLHNFYYRPRISIQHLDGKRGEGLIFTSSCIGGVVSKRGTFVEDTGKFVDTEGNATKAMEKFAAFAGDRFYAEIQDNPTLWQQKAYNEWLVNRASEMGIPLVLTSDAHFLTKPDKATHDLIMAQQMKKTLEEHQSDEDGMVYGDGHYIRSPDEMYEAALKYGAEESFYNTTKIADQCDIQIELGKYELPDFDHTQEPDYEDFKKWKASRFECM